MANIASFTSRYSPHNILAILGVLLFVAGTISAILLIINTPDTLQASPSEAHNLKKDATKRIYIVPKGSTSRKIGEELVTFGYVRSGLQFELLIDLSLIHI